MSNIISKYKETGMISIDQPVGYNTMKSRLYNWKKRGLLSHIRRGVYLPANIQNKYQIACNSVDNSLPSLSFCIRVLYVTDTGI